MNDMQVEIDKFVSERLEFDKSKTNMQFEIDKLSSEKDLFQEVKMNLQSEINLLKSEKQRTNSHEQVSLCFSLSKSIEFHMYTVCQIIAKGNIIVLTYR